MQWCSGLLLSQLPMCQGSSSTGKAVTVDVTCCCVCALGDSTMCQCLCGCDSCALFLAMVYLPEWGSLGDINIPNITVNAVAAKLSLCGNPRHRCLCCCLYRVLVDRHVCLPGLQVYICGFCYNLLWDCLCQARKCWVWLWVHVSCGLLWYIL